jgi:hypothetical protein
MDRRPLGVTAFFSHLGEQFVEGRLEEIADRWTFPCPVEVGGQLVVMREPKVFVAYLVEQRQVALSRGLTGMKPRVSAIEMPRNGRFRVWLRWMLQYGDHVEQMDDGVVYFMSAAPGGRLSVEMMDIVHIATEQAAAQSA